MEGIMSLRAAGMLAYAYYTGPENVPTKHIPWDGSGDDLFTKMIKGALVREPPAAKNGGVIFCCGSGLMRADAVSELGFPDSNKDDRSLRQKRPSGCT